MKRAVTVLLALMGLFAALVQAAPDKWVPGRDYVLLAPVQPTSVARGKVEVMEVFSYGCVYCNKFQPVIDQLQRQLPANARMTFLPAAFGTAEDWPMFQRAYFAAQALGIAAKTHQALFDAVWQSGELGIMDTASNRLKNPLPSIDQAAQVYERLTGVKADQFVRMAHSPAVDAKIKSADAQVLAMQVPGTPCLVVNGKYRVVMDNLAGPDDVLDIVKFLVAKETSH